MTRDADGGGGRRRIQVAVIVVALGAVGAIFWTTNEAGEALPDTPESETLWMCHACGHAFRLTASAVAEERRRAGGLAPLLCPTCSEREAYRAAVCGQCGTMFLGPDAPGSSGVCPQCYPDHEPVGFPEDPAGGASEDDSDRRRTVPNV